MSTDLSQFYDVFYEESFEGLDTMESELLVLQPGNVDSETLNTIFRAAHSIKGGSGTFGFTDVADFTHVVETLLDQLRDGRRELIAEYVDLLLKSVDCLRGLLTSLQQEMPVDTEESHKLIKEYEAILEGQSSESSSTDDTSHDSCSDVDEASTSEVSDNTIWSIYFKPDENLFKTGNEPLYMFMELADLGDVTINAHCDGLPTPEHLHPDDCYFAWSIKLATAESKSRIEEIFEWVVDESELTIEPLVAEDDEPEELFVINDESEQPSTPAEPEPLPKVDETAPPQDTKAATKKPENTSIRVSIDKVDSLINMVGELVITQAMLQQLSEGELDENALVSLNEGLAQLAHNTRDLQESVMQIRMLPISFVFSRFPRLVRDISQKLGKQVELKLFGESTELDKTVMEKISDPIVHLIRNSMDHGLETPGEREALGKDPVGSVTLNAFHQGGNIVIEIADDGRGLNSEKIRDKAIERGLISAEETLSVDDINELIFRPGFSTANEVSDISGRGVGMDVVRRNIQELNGSVEVMSEEGQGSTFTIRLPLTLAILDGQLVTVDNHVYIIPLVNIIESIQINIEQVNHVAGDMAILRQRDEYIPILRLNRLFNHSQDNKHLDKGLLVIVDSDSGKVGLLVDDLLSQQQVVIKSLEANFQRVEGVSGATILGDGTVSLIVDISGLIKLAGLKKAGRNGLNFNLPVDKAG